MKKILKFENFKKLNEAYEEDPEYRIKKYFVELETNIKKWFTEGGFAVKGVQLFDVKMNTTNNVDKYLTFDFQDDNYYYQIMCIISLQEVTEETLKECFIKVKRYDIDTSELIKQIEKSVMVKDISEDKIAELISSLDDESDDKTEEESDYEMEESEEDLTQTDDTDF